MACAPRRRSGAPSSSSPSSARRLGAWRVCFFFRRSLARPRSPCRLVRLRSCRAVCVRASSVCVCATAAAAARSVLLTLDEKDPRRLFEGSAILRQCRRIGVLDENQMKLDFVLSLTIAVRRCVCFIVSRVCVCVLCLFCVCVCVFVCLLCVCLRQIQMFTDAHNRTHAHFNTHTHTNSSYTHRTFWIAVCRRKCTSCVWPSRFTTRAC